MQIHLTGFGPFGDNTTNPSGEIASAMDGTILRVSYRTVDEFCGEGRAGFFLCLGLHAKATQPRLEVCAYNRASPATPDVDGAVFEKNHIVEDGDDSLGTKVDIPELFAHLINRGFPCSISDNAGSYLCNYTYYKALDKTNGNALFIHLPPESEDWPLSRMRAFVEEVRGWVVANHKSE